MSDYITFALPKGRIMQDSMELFGKIGDAVVYAHQPGDGRRQP